MVLLSEMMGAIFQFGRTFLRTVNFPQKAVLASCSHHQHSGFTPIFVINDCKQAKLLLECMMVVDTQKIILSLST